MHVRVIKPKRWNRVINEDSDKLWLRIRKGDKEALAKTFCLYYSKLFNYGYNMVPQEAFVKDCIQELFLTIWAKRNRINEAYAVKSYLFHSLRRIMFRNRTRQKNRNKRNQVYTDNFFENTVNVEELIIHYETNAKQKKQLSQAIDSLSERQKEAIYLKFYDGLSNSEIAFVMGINKQSVYNHISSAIQKIQGFISN